MVDQIKSCEAVARDSPNGLKQLRLDFCAKYSWIVNVKCVLRVINLKIQDFVKHDLVRPWAMDISFKFGNILFEILHMETSVTRMGC